jgi:uncharacterized RDD family membrane protein YckC
MLDTPRVVATPEGIELTLKVAGPVARARAWVIDFLLRAVVYIAFATLLSLFGKFGAGLVLLMLFLLEWAYPVLFEVLWNGATPGKRACHLRVLHDDGTPIGWRASVIRNTLRAVDFLPLMYGFGLIACLSNRDFKRLGDLAAGTLVVYAPPASAIGKRLEASRTSGVAPSSGASFPLPKAALTLEEQRAIIDFAERRKRWSDQRVAELAAHATAVFDGANGQVNTDKPATAEQLVGLAHVFTGRIQPPSGPDIARADRESARVSG